ncbi:lipoyltransferase 1 [Brevipalpus obovatus]|uniref:lipoyltransferase 1 n=1 Tax=Brevipalpus obovatus TaxID=246614 RepID=UPI003D9EB9F9
MHMSVKGLALSRKTTQFYSIRFLSDILARQSSVIISHSDDIFTNLALEDWLFQKLPLHRKSPWYHLLLWSNNPCVVIGKHQNPWNELKVGTCQSLGIPIARRKSGGGTVYHDMGNLNLCFLSDSTNHNRKRNNELIVRLLARKYGIDCVITERDNLNTKEGFKVSGTASKLTPKSTYHHCTLLVDADLTVMHRILRKECELIENKATPSVHSSVCNLAELSDRVSMHQLIHDIAQEFSLEMDRSDIREIDQRSLEFPEIEVIRREISDWNWIFGKTPGFNINFSQKNIHLRMNIYHGKVRNAETSLPLDLTPLIGLKFSKDELYQCLRVFESSRYASVLREVLSDIVDKTIS